MIHHEYDFRCHDGHTVTAVDVPEVGGTASLDVAKFIGRGLCECWGVSCVEISDSDTGRLVAVSYPDRSEEVHAFDFDDRRNCKSHPGVKFRGADWDECCRLAKAHAEGLLAHWGDCVIEIRDVAADAIIGSVSDAGFLLIIDDPAAPARQEDEDKDNPSCLCCDEEDDCPNCEAF